MKNNIIYSKILVEVINVGFLGKPADNLNNLLNSEPINWVEMQRMISYHSINPLAYEAFSKSNLNLVSKDFLEELKLGFEQSALWNLHYSVEMARLLTLCKEHGIRVLPFKGNLIIHEIHNNKQIRESGDLDVLFHPEDIIPAVELLIKDGYVFNLIDKNLKGNITNDIIVNNIKKTSADVEIPMFKNRVHLDVHWGLYYTFLPFKVNYKAFFDGTVRKKFYGYDVDLPNPEVLFWMIIVHHGSKELWLLDKHFVDLMGFLKQYSLEWNKIFEKAKQQKLYKITLLGFYLIKTKFDFDLPLEIENELKSFDTSKVYLVEDYIANGQKWDKTLYRWRYEVIMYNFQDEGFSLLKYIKGIFESYSRKSVTESKRIVEFPEQYYFLNFCGKVFTYLWKKTF